MARVADGLRLNGPSLIRTTLGANSLNKAVRSAQSMTVEMWIDPANLASSEQTLLQLAPSSPGNQNLSLSQSSTSLRTALRTSMTNALGTPAQVANAAIADGLHQVVYVRRPSGGVEVYVDGTMIWSDNRAGSLAAWGAGYALALGNNIARTSPWTGDLFLMAVYDDDLSALEISQNFLAGVLPPSSNQPPAANAGPDLTVIEGAQATMAATATDDGLPAPPAALTTTWSQLTGPATALFTDVNSATSTVTLPAVGVYTFRWTATDGERTTIDQVQVTVVAIVHIGAPAADLAGRWRSCGLGRCDDLELVAEFGDPLHARWQRSDRILAALRRTDQPDRRHHREGPSLQSRSRSVDGDVGRLRDWCRRLA